jgi:deoxycytidine triphosphate deaminase/intein/homing endonuclease
VILSDRSIREELDTGRIVIEPLGADAIQPSSVDLHVDRYFRVFRNDTTPYIDPKQHQEDLTELVEVTEGGAFILHPGEFVLGSTLERVALPTDLVARLEGKSSLGRLGLLIHSSLPASETILVLADGQLRQRPIEEVVRKQQRAFAVAFDPESFRVGFHEITGWYEGPPDRIFEVSLASGRRVRVTAGHNLFTVDRDGSIRKVRTGELTVGTRVAVPHRLPEVVDDEPLIDVVGAIPESEYERIVCDGPAVAQAFDSHPELVATALRAKGYRHVDYYRGRQRLPLVVALQAPGLASGLGADDRLSYRGSRSSLASTIAVDSELAWLLGMYVAEGYRRDNQFVISNTDQQRLDRIEATVRRLGLPVYRTANAITCCSTFASSVLEWLGAGGRAQEKRVPTDVLSWPRRLVEAFLEGLVDGDGSADAARTSIWTTSAGLVGDLLLLGARLGLRVGTCWRDRGHSPICQVYMPTREHKLLTSVPLPDALLVGVRARAGLSQAAAGALAGYKHASDLNNIERRRGRDAVRRSTLRRLRDAYRSAAGSTELARLDRLVDGDLLWDKVVSVVDTGVTEAIYDIEVRPGGRHIENFLAGYGGVFVSNTAGFVDAGWDGHLTLELSNVANLPIALYPGMKIGQISFLRMTTPADVPYGGATTGSKYQGQRGPTPSRYYQNFTDDT